MNDITMSDPPTATTTAVTTTSATTGIKSTSASDTPTTTTSPSPPPPPPPPTVSFSSLFRYADSVDVFLFIIVLLCAAGTGVVIPLLSLILGKLLNGASAAASSSSSPALGEDLVNTAALYMALVAIAAFITLGGGIYLSFLSSQRQVHKLRLAYLKALLSQDMGYADTHSLPEQAARLTEDTLTVQAGIGDKLFLILTGLAQFVGSLVLAFSVASQAWRLALALLVTLPVAVGAVGFLFTFITSMSGESDDAYARAGEVLVESLAMIRTVAALGGEEHEASRYDKHLATAEGIGRKKGIISGIGQGIFVGVMCSVYAIGLYAGSRFIALNRTDHPECILDPEASYFCFSGGTVIQVLFGVIGGAFSLGIVAPNISYVGGAQAAAARMYKVIDSKPLVDPFATDGIIPDTPAKGKIEFRNVTFAYPSRPDEVVLRDFSLSIEPGQKVALVGPSGSGKSTIVALLQRWYEPKSGEILLDGVDIRRYNVEWLRSQQALVGQEPQLLPMSIRDNIASGLPSLPSSSSSAAAAVSSTTKPKQTKTHDEGKGKAAEEEEEEEITAQVVAAAMAADAHGFISLLPDGYNTLVTTSKLSGGQKQRVCISRAVIRRAPILLLDEATSALDSRSEKLVQAAIDKLLLISSSSSATTSSNNNNTSTSNTTTTGLGVEFTSISIAHRLSTITRSDVIVVIEKGTLIEHGTHAQLIQRGGLYARLFDLQSRGKQQQQQQPRQQQGIENDDKGIIQSPIVSTPTPTPTPTATSSTIDLPALETTTLPSTSNPSDGILVIRSPLHQLEKRKHADEVVVAVADQNGDNVASDVADSKQIDASSSASSSPSSWAPITRVPYRRAWSLQAPEACWIYFGIILAALNGLLLPSFALLLTKFIVIFYEPDSDVMISKATVYLAIFFGLAAVCFIFNTLQGYAFASAGEPFVRRLRRAAFASIMSQSIGFLEYPTNSPGQLSARLGLDATKMKLALGPRLGEKISAIATLLAGMALAFSASWQLTLIIALLGPLVVYAADAENQVTFSSNEVVKQSYAEAGGVASEAVSAIRVVHSFGLQGVTLDKFGAALAVPFNQGYKRAAGLGIGFGSNQCLQNLVAAIVFKAGLTLQLAGVVKFEDIFLVFFAFQFACFGLPQLTSLMSDLAGIRDALKSFFSMILKVPDIDGTESTAEKWEEGQRMKKTTSTTSGGGSNDTDAGEEKQQQKSLSSKAIAVPEGRIEFRNVRFSYPTRPDAKVLRGLNLSIAPGQTVALVGPSGSGKSSIVSLLLRLYSPTSGEILVDGHDITTYPARAVRDAIGWVGQEAPLFADSVAYNIAYGRNGGQKKKPIPESGMPRDATVDAVLPLGFQVETDVIEAASKANAKGFVDAFRHGFATHVGDGGRNVSGGQKQRIACARAIIREGVRLVLLDEATSALDSESEKLVQDSIDTMLREQGHSVTTIIIAHRLSTIVHCDIIAVINDGEVVEQGKFEDLISIKNGLFRKLAEAQGFKV